MRLLLDTCVWGPATIELEQAGHDVEWTGDWAKDPGDAEILSQAFEAKRVLVTLDKDFGELAVVKGVDHCGIIRIVGFSAREQAPVCLEVIERYESELENGALVTVGPTRIRVRPKG